MRLAGPVTLADTCNITERSHSKIRNVWAFKVAALFRIFKDRAKQNLPGRCTTKVERACDPDMTSTFPLRVPVSY